MPTPPEISKRDAEIVRRILSGEKRYVIAMDYGVTAKAITVVGRKGGLPAYQRYTRTKAAG